MESLQALFDAYEVSPAYIHLPQDTATLSALMGRLGPSLELEELVNAHSAAATLEGFVNGYLCAQATARECVELRRLPEISVEYDPGQKCGNCRYFAQHYRYTGKPPWYAPVHFGHCMAPERDKRKGRGVTPLWCGCSLFKSKLF